MSFVTPNAFLRNLGLHLTETSATKLCHAAMGYMFCISLAIK